MSAPRAPVDDAAFEATFARARERVMPPLARARRHHELDRDYGPIVSEHLEWCMREGLTAEAVIQSLGLRTHPFKLYAWADARWALVNACEWLRGRGEEIAPIDAFGAGSAARLRAAVEASRPPPAETPPEPKPAPAEPAPEAPNGATGRAAYRKRKREMLTEHQKRRKAARAKARRAARRAAGAPEPDQDEEIARHIAEKGVTKCPEGWAWGTAKYDELARHGG